MCVCVHVALFSPPFTSLLYSLPPLLHLAALQGSFQCAALACVRWVV